ncbi:MAG: PIG-L family deacetylase [Oscillospiraceae bacterium]|nr:PIG-L family deacetylase [Oscillospiraceae bacterium]
MKERITKLIHRVVHDFFSILVACELLLFCVVADMLFEWKLPQLAFVLILFVPMHVLMMSKRIRLKYIAAGMAGLAVFFGITAISAYAGWVRFTQTSTYEAVDQGKNSIFGGKRVMAIVPHQDDDLNLMGGMIEEYVKYGSEIYVVFVTNGDYLGIPHIRHAEALQVLGSLGVEQDHVIFLGYGDQYELEGPHIYNAPAGEVVRSYFGKTETYGSDYHSAYREGRPYTNESFMSDLESVILEYRADVIFCSDYDPHRDHKATSLAFEKVMGEILKEHTDYRPTVYKGYAYYTAWTAADDYYRVNIASSGNMYSAYERPEVAIYRWEDRVRFPVNAASLSRSMLGSDAYRCLADYSSQGATRFAGQVINGDKVFWQRRTDSLCLTSEILTSSGDESLLNDFMLIENNDLQNELKKPYDGVWSPLESDSEKTAEIIFSEPSDLYSIMLYDHPASNENVTGVEILFDDGTKLLCENLDASGAATEIVVEKQSVSSFTVKIVSAEGLKPGLSEIEAFAVPSAGNGKILKLMDAEGNFVYDYWTDKEGNAVLSAYTYGVAYESKSDSFSVSVSNPICEAQWENGNLVIHCPSGEETILSISDDTEGVSDQVWIRNPKRTVRMWNDFFQLLEKRIFKEYNAGTFNKLLEEPAIQWGLEKMKILEYYLKR